MTTSIAEFLAEAAGGDAVPWAAEREAARRFGASAREVEAAALAAGLVPARYARNAGTVGVEGQAALHRSAVAVVGCGGLGGYLVEELARLGVGTIVVVDPDVVEESNLNRQLLATVDDIGIPKVELAARRVAQVNPATRARPYRLRLDSRNAASVLEGVDAVADGLDTIPDRLEIAGACSALGLPFVHASVASWYAQATTQPAGRLSLREVYGPDPPARGAEAQLGNAAFTPALAASLEAAELCRILTGKGPALAGRLLMIDLLAMEFVTLPI